MLETLGTSSRVTADRRKVRKSVWLCILLALGVNVLLFLALSVVNRNDQRAGEPLEFVPIEVYVPPPEPEHILPEPVRPVVEPERTPPPVEPLKPMTIPVSFTPRLLPAVASDGPVMAPSAADLRTVTVASGPMGTADVDRPPQKIHAPYPPYPYWARLRSLEGAVTVEFVVDGKGKVGNVRVVKVEGDRRFGDAVRKAVEKWRYRPGWYAGRPVPVRVLQSVRFKLER